MLYHFIFSSLIYAELANRSLGTLCFVLLIFTKAMNNEYCDPHTTYEAVRAKGGLSNLLKSTRQGWKLKWKKKKLISKANYSVSLQLFLSQKMIYSKRVSVVSQQLWRILFQLYMVDGSRNPWDLIWFLWGLNSSPMFYSFICLGCQNARPTTEPAYSI